MVLVSHGTNGAGCNKDGPQLLICLYLLHYFEKTIYCSTTLSHLNSVLGLSLQGLVG